MHIDCGGSIEAYFNIFNNFTNAAFVYDNAGLVDNETIISMDINLWCTPIGIVVDTNILIQIIDQK